jgi:rRNA maturation endonuclease Nob1
MRTLVEPPPSSRCDLCGGELRLKLIESANRTLDIEPANHTLDIEPANHTLDLDNEILVCVNCGHEQSNIVKHNHNMPTPKAA